MVDDDARTPTMLEVHLQVMKCNQSDKGFNVYVGKINTLHCPVVAVVSYMATHDEWPGPFFLRQSGEPFTKL